MTRHFVSIRGMQKKAIQTFSFGTVRHYVEVLSSPCLNQLLKEVYKYKCQPEDAHLCAWGRRVPHP